MKVWIDQDMCTGDGLCTEIVPHLFQMGDDGLAYVMQDGQMMGPGRDNLAPFEEKDLPDVEEAAEDCPGECIFIERD